MPAAGPKLNQRLAIACALRLSVSRQVTDFNQGHAGSVVFFQDNAV